jgi:hypothetical protein
MRCGACALLLVVGLAGTARAGDSPSACPTEPSSSRDPQARDFGELDGYTRMGPGLRDAFNLGLAAVTPAVGLEIERGRDLPATSLAWSASVPFGPVTACQPRTYSHPPSELQSLRATIEGGVVIRAPAWPYLRPGLRAIWHRSTWRLGVGAGIGSTIALMPGQHGAAAVSPELLLHYGRCCDSGYWVLALRTDVFFPRRYPTTAGASIAFAFW